MQRCIVHPLLCLTFNLLNLASIFINSSYTYLHFLEQISVTFSVGKLLTTRGVHTGPGAMQLQRMPFSATSRATPFVNVTIAPCNEVLCHSIFKDIS